MILSDRRGPRGSWPRRFTAGLCLLALATQMGCHAYVAPQQSVPASGRAISVELNDRGRGLVGGQLGESVLHIQGQLIGSTDSEVTLSVARTVSLQGSSVVWSGERVVIPREGIGRFRVREFSRGRTMLLAAGVIAGVLALGSLISLAAGGNGRPFDTGGCTSNCNEK